MIIKNIFFRLNSGLLCKISSVALLAVIIALDNPSLVESALAESVLEEITVTATRRESSALDTGVSLSAITEESLERDGYDSFGDFATSVAGLSFGQRGPGQSVVVLRGINSSSNQFNTDEPEAKASVGVYFDDTPVSLGGYNPDPRLFDINRIEVLRGPQGTLFGAGSMSGTIRYITNAPDPSGFSSKLKAGSSLTDSGGHNYELNGMFNVPLGDIAAVRAVAFRRDIDGFIDNAGRSVNTANPFAPVNLRNVNTDETNGGRIQFLLEPADGLSLTARAYYQKTDTGGYPTTDTANPARGVFPPPGTGGNNRADATLGPLMQDRGVREPSTDEFKLFSFDFDYDLGFAELTSVTSYMERDLDQNFEQSDFVAAVLPPVTNPGLVGPLTNTTETENIVQEVRLVSNTDSALQWILGFFYSQQDKVYKQDSPQPTGSNVPTGNVFQSAQTFDERQYAVFGETSYEVNDQFKGIVGLRYYDYKQDMVFDSIGGVFSGGVDTNRTIEEDGINPKFSVEWRPIDDTLVYATAAKGFRLGGTNDPVPALPGCTGLPDNPNIESDSLWNYELGYKKDADRFNFSGAAYLIDWKDAPISDSLPCGFGTTRNGPDIQSIGIEAETTVAVTDDFFVNANATYNKSEFTERFTDSTIPGFLVMDGTETPLVPKVAFNFGATYYFPVSAYEAYVGANYSFQGKRFNRANLNRREELDSYGIFNLKAGIDADNWQVSVFIDNVTNEHEVLFKDTVFLFHNRDTINRPRTIGTSLTYQF